LVLISECFFFPADLH